MRLFLFILLMLPGLVHAERGFAANAYVENLRADFEREDGTVFELTRRRFGLEYWEPVQGDFAMGLQVGYSETETDNASRPFAATSGMFGGIGARYESWLSTHWRLLLRADAQYQREDRAGYDSADFEFSTRLLDTRAEAAVRFEQGAFRIAPGLVWRDADYREITRRDAGDTRSESDINETGGVFVEVGVNAENGGTVTLRLEQGAYTGAQLRFEKRF